VQDVIESRWVYKTVVTVIMHDSDKQGQADDNNKYDAIGKPAQD
jgi:hypothetical protein